MGAGVGERNPKMGFDKKLVNLLRQQFRLYWSGLHGIGHWSRVRVNGALICEAEGADKQIVTYFALLHDACRENEYADPNHGRRASDLAKTLRDDYIHLNNHQFDLLLEALEGHTGGSNPSDLNVAACWDADRLDIGRVGSIPDPRYLFTEYARQDTVIKNALRRSQRQKRLSVHCRSA